MKNSKLLVILFPVLVVALVFFLANSFVGPKIDDKRTAAEAAEQQADSLERQVQAGQKSKQNSAELTVELAKIRTVLPDAPEQVIEPVIAAISKAATARGVVVTVQDQPTSPLVKADTTATTAPPAPSADGKQEDKPKQVNPELVRSYTVSIEVDGPLPNVLDFIGDLPTSGRLFVYKVDLQGADDADGFSPDYKGGADPVTARLELRSYVDASVSPTGAAGK